MALIVALAAPILTKAAMPQANAQVTDSIIHTGTGRAINVVAVGDSYAAGNGGGNYYTSSPDDPNIPPFAGNSLIPGSGCYRSWGVSNFLAYQMLGSRGYYINRACSGTLTSDVNYEVHDLSGTPAANAADLVVLSAGGNDAHFADIVKDCFVLASQDPNTFIDDKGRIVSVTCAQKIADLGSMVNTIVSSEQQNLIGLAGTFPNAKFVLDGYPLLASRVKNIPGSLVTSNWNYAYEHLLTIETDARNQQAAMVAALKSGATGNGILAGRVGFNDVFTRFGTTHGMQTRDGAIYTDPWLISPTKVPIWMETAHPNAEGQQEIGDGILSVVRSNGWFANYPVQTKPVSTYHLIPGNVGAVNGVIAGPNGRQIPVMDGENTVLSHCANGQTVRNLRVEMPSAAWQGSLYVTNGTYGQDQINVSCSYPSPGDIVSATGADGTHYSFEAVASSRNWPYPGTKLVRIPTTWMYGCLAGRGATLYQEAVYYLIQTDTKSMLPGDGSCVPAAWKNHVITGPDNWSWFVGGGGYKHHILSTQTFVTLTNRYGPTIRISPQIDVDEIPVGSDQPEDLGAARHEGTIIRRNDGVSWVVSGGQRHHIPNRSTDVCAVYKAGLTVSETNLSYALANSIPESSTPYSCDLSHTILEATDQPAPHPSFTFHDGQRFHIPDSWTYHYFQRQGWPVVDVPLATINLLSDGGTETARLDPRDITPNTIIRRNDGVSWVVDGSRVRHHIPYAQDDVCWRDLRGFTVSATGLTYGQANSLPEADGWPCIIGNAVVKSSDGSSWFVDTSNTRHWIPDTETFWVLAGQYPVYGPWPSGDVNQIPQGSNEPQMIDPNSVKNSIICRNDGVCWVVDGNGWRHWIPTYADNVCWRWQAGWHVSRSGLSYDQANSLPESNAWGCQFNGRIMVANEGAAYWIGSDNVRHWIQDPASFDCYVDMGYPVTRGISQGELNPIPEGSWLNRCLSPSRVKNHIVRVTDGTAYFIDSNGWWYWIPNGGVWGCLTSKYSIYDYNATWDQVNTIRRERGVWAYCGQ